MPFGLLSLRGGARDLSAKSFEPAVDAGVEDLVPDAQHQATNDVRVDLVSRLDLSAGRFLDAAFDRGYEALVELDGARHLDREHLVLLAPELVEGPADAERRRQPVALGQELEEVEEALVAPVDDPADCVLLLRRAEPRREEESLQGLVLAERI